MKAICIVLLVLSLLAACAGVQASIIYKFTFDVPASSPGPSPYAPAPNEILPSGISSIRLENITDIAVPLVSGKQGGNVLSQTLGGAWPNTQGYRFGADGTQYIGTPGPVIANAWTIEAVVNPDLSGCQFGKTDRSNIINSEQLGDGTPWGDVALYADQNTGLVTFAPSGQSYGVIQSTTALQSGLWYHIVAVVRPGTVQQTELWINGALEGVGSYPAGWETQDLFKIPGYFNIGSCYWPVNAKNWQGQIDALAISDTALDAGNFVFLGRWLNRPYMNVKDYGAKGDGVTDDTAAIRAAMTAAATRNWVIQEYSGDVPYCSYATVFFPAGKYIVSDSIEIKANVMGEGTPILYQSNTAKDILYSFGAWRYTISGMSFVAGQNQIKLGTGGADGAQITIEKCHFKYAADCAIRTLADSTSAQITISDCVVVNCNQTFINYCDDARLVTSWITSSQNMVNKAVIENRGVLLAKGILGVPSVVSANDQRWIDNYGSVTCRDFRFGGESGGFTPVVNFAPYDYSSPVNPTSVVLDSCEIYTLGNPARQCAVYCEEIPNQLTVRSCRGFPGIPAGVLAFRPTIDFNTYFDNAETRSGKCLRFLVDTNNTALPDSALDLPEQMRPYQANPIEGTAVPTTGYWKVGQFVKNRNCNGDTTPFGWECTVSGKPGTWMQVMVTQY